LSRASQSRKKKQGKFPFLLLHGSTFLHRILRKRGRKIAVTHTRSYCPFLILLLFEKHTFPASRGTPLQARVVTHTYRDGDVNVFYVVVWMIRSLRMYTREREREREYVNVLCVAAAAAASAAADAIAAAVVVIYTVWAFALPKRIFTAGL
jgi:hypothetical protein